MSNTLTDLPRSLLIKYDVFREGGEKHVAEIRPFGASSVTWPCQCKHHTSKCKLLRSTMQHRYAENRGQTAKVVWTATLAHVSVSGMFNQYDMPCVVWFGVSA